MTAKEKSVELVYRLIPYTRNYTKENGWEDDIFSAKQCALIAVDEILSLIPLANRDYWEEVRIEIVNIKTKT